MDHGASIAIGRLLAQREQLRDFFLTGTFNLLVDVRLNT